MRDADVSDTDVVVQNGRVRAGYHVGKLVEPEVIVHLIGERPGTGLNTLSAYLTYGRDEAGRLRWNPRHGSLLHDGGVRGASAGQAAGRRRGQKSRGSVARMIEQRRLE